MFPTNQQPPQPILPPSSQLSQTPQLSPQPQQPQPFVGVLVPGGLVRTDACPVDSSGTKYSLQYLYPRDFPPQTPLAAITEIVAFLVQPQPQSPQSPPIPVLPPPDHGVLLYWQIAANGGASSTGFELLGDTALTWDKPSAVLSTKWGEHEHIIEASSQNNLEFQITIGISIEPISTITNLLGDGNAGMGATRKAQSMERRLLVAQNIARDLFQYMQSFDTGAAAGSQRQTMVVPTNIFDRWFQRFTSRFRRDPNFFMKQRNNDG